MSYTSKSSKTALLFSSTAIAALSFSSASFAERLAPPQTEKMEEIVVSSAYEGRKLGETILGATILNKKDIERQLEGSIGETLRHEPGMSSTFFGPGASRPIIRGLGGDRIRILDNGLGSIDASTTSPDHAVAVEPALAERIEILRGTAMLMYGSSAAGGVVNVIDGRIPNHAIEKGAEGGLRLSHTTVDDGDEASASVNAQLVDLGDKQIILHVDGIYRDTSDYSIPGYAESAAQRASEEEEEEEGHHDEEEEVKGTVENTQTHTESGSAGLSMILPNGFFGFNVKTLSSKYGVPGHSHEHEGEEEEEGDHEDEEGGVVIDLDQTRVDFQGELEGDFAFFKKAKMRFGYADYTHTELEDGAPGTVFSNEGYEGRLDLIEKGNDVWGGATGIHIKKRDFSAIGEEAFVPPTHSLMVGIYSVKDITLGNFQLDFGGRYEHTTHKARARNVSKEYNNISLSAGAGYDLSDESFLGITVSRTERTPSTEALFMDGAHEATKSYEIGDTNLGKETAYGVEGTYKFNNDKFSFVLNAYVTSYKDFIYDAQTGEIRDDLPVFQFTATDATIYGFETKGEYHAATINSSKFGDIDIHLDGQLDMVRDDLKGTKDYLPRMPPMKALMGIAANAGSFDVRTELEYNAKQTRVGANEFPTDDYLMWNAYLSVRPFSNPNISIGLRGTNLLNQEAREHTSSLKELAPLPGRNVKISMSMNF